MRTAVVLLFAVGLSVAAPVPNAEKKPDDAEAILGTWCSHTLKEVEANPKLVCVFYVFEPKGALLRAYSIGGTTPGTFNIDTTANPKALDLFETGGKSKETQAAIYELNGDTLKLCISKQVGGMRPKEFKATEDALLIILKRRPATKDER